MITRSASDSGLGTAARALGVVQSRRTACRTPHCLGSLLRAVTTRRGLPRRLFLRHDSILVSKVRSLYRTQCGSQAGPSAGSCTPPAAAEPSRSTQPAEVLTAEDSIPDDLQKALERIHTSRKVRTKLSKPG